MFLSRISLLLFFILACSYAFPQISNQIADSITLKNDSVTIDSAAVIKRFQERRIPAASTVWFTREEYVADQDGHVPDTILTNVHRYNPVYKRSFAAITLGNIGLAEKILYLEDVFPAHFRFRTDPFSVYHFNSRELKLYDTRTPYTEIHFAQKGRIEQYIQASHSRSFKRVFNAGFDFRKIKTEGVYQRQAADHGSLDVYARYNARINRYSAIAGFIRNKSVVQENGGVDFDTIPEFFFGNKLFLPVKLTAASNFTLARELFLDQTIFLGKKTEGDSLHHSFVEPKFSLTHTAALELKDEVFRDTEPSELFYPVTLFPGVSILDSVRIRSFNNSLILRSTAANNFIRLRTGGEHSTNSVSQSLVDTIFSTSRVFAEAGKDLFNWISAGASISYAPAGYNSGDYRYSVALGTVKDSTLIGLLASYTISAHEPDYFYKVYRSQLSTRYNNGLEKVNSKEALLSATAFRSKLSATLRYNEFQNYTYLDSQINVVQYKPTLSYISATLRAHLTLARKWNFVHELLWQNVSDTAVVHLPELAARITYYYQNRIFKKRLEIQTGFELNYATPFFADAYMPGFRSFYLQNTAQGGGYPFVDIFFSFKVKARAKVFIKFEHVNSGFVYIPYYYVPVYPQADRALKFGVNWKFFD